MAGWDDDDDAEPDDDFALTPPDEHGDDDSDDDSTPDIPQTWDEWWDFDWENYDGDYEEYALSADYGGTEQ